MIKKYIIDGNNLIGKMKGLRIKNQTNKSKPDTREQIIPILDRYFAKKKNKVSLHLDGFPSNPLRSGSMKIIYSYESSADKQIKIEISNEKNPRTLCIVSSDYEIYNFAKACSSKVLKSEEFAKLLEKSSSGFSEEEIIKSISKEEIKKAFGIE